MLSEPSGAMTQIKIRLKGVANDLHQLGEFLEFSLEHEAPVLHYTSTHQDVHLAVNLRPIHPFATITAHYLIPEKSPIGLSFLYSTMPYPIQSAVLSFNIGSLLQCFILYASKSE